MPLYVRLSSPGGAPDTVPSALAAPTITASSTQLVATWSTPPSDGGSPITSYDLRHSVQAAATWTTITGVTAPRTITTLVNGTTYEVQVRAVNAIGVGAWSPSGLGTPAANVFGFRGITSSAEPAGTAIAVPSGALAGDTLIFVASRDFDIAGTSLAPATATAVTGTPTNQTGGYPSYQAWYVLSWNGTTTTYDFGMSGSWAGERAIIAMQGAATAITAGTYGVGAGTTLGWTGMTMAAVDMAIAVGGTYDGADSPVTSFDTSWTGRRAQGVGEWAGFTLWTKQLSAAGTIAPSPGGTVGTGNWSTLLLRVAP